MVIKKYFHEQNDARDMLYKFAFCGRMEVFDEYIVELANMAEEEIWTSFSSTDNNDILKNYLIYTFEKAAFDNKVLINSDETYACFNTSLLTDKGEDIICIFNTYESSEIYHWHLYGFRKESSWDFLNNFSETPSIVSYFDEPSKIYFNPNLSVVKNLDHIITDNFCRFPTSLQNKGESYVLSLLNQALDLTIKRCKRNYRIAVPQYYNNEITYLLPVILDNTFMACAVEFVNGRYRVNTIFTLDMAYKNARLLMKPEADWLSSNIKKES